MSWNYFSGYMLFVNDQDVLSVTILLLFCVKDPSPLLRHFSSWNQLSNCHNIYCTLPFIIKVFSEVENVSFVLENISYKFASDYTMLVSTHYRRLEGFKLAVHDSSANRLKDPDCCHHTCLSCYSRMYEEASEGPMNNLRMKCYLASTVHNTNMNVFDRNLFVWNEQRVKKTNESSCFS